MWSFRIGEVLGIDVRLHAAFAFVAALVVAQYAQRHGGAGAAFGGAAMLLLVVSLALHELGHAVMARRFGLGVRSIVLLPLGGVLRFVRPPQRPGEELLIYGAGPVTSLALGFALLALGRWLGVPLVFAEAQPAPSWTTLLLLLGSANVVVGLLNCLPVFPLDGGRVLRALLGYRLGYGQATVAASFVGQVLAVGMAVVSLVQAQLMLALVAVLLFFAAGRERVEARLRQALSILRAREIYLEAVSVSPGTPLSELASRVAQVPMTVFAVRLGEELLGVVTRQDALAGAEQPEDHPYAASVMWRNVPEVEADATAEELLSVMQVCRVPVVAVRHGEELLGFATQERVLQLAHGG